jgi:glycosyltransferase involved in cell wall biosynthesis
MKVTVFLNHLGLGGTEKAAIRWALGLKQRGHTLTILALSDGPRRNEVEMAGLPLKIVSADSQLIAGALRDLTPEVVHAHAPGRPHVGDVLGKALSLLPQKIPVVQTNVFGRLENPHENAWTDFRLFISWTSCVQAARRSFRRLDENFFRRASVTVYPLDPVEPFPADEITTFRKNLGVTEDDVLLGRLSRPEPNKWTNLALDAFRMAAQKNGKIKLLLREPPPLVAAALRQSPDADRFIILPATMAADELRLTLSALDVVLHTSIIGESFGYGIAEPMNLGKPVVTHSVPWCDQAQIELVRHGEGGFIASTTTAMNEAILRLAKDNRLRQSMGLQALKHIRQLADPEISVNRLEAILHAVVKNQDNPFIYEDLNLARTAAGYLDIHQFGHSWAEQLTLRPFYYRVRFNELRKKLK